MHRFLKKVFRLFSEAQISNSQFPISNERVKMLNKTIKGVTEDMEELRYNTAIAKLMEYYNFLVKQDSLSLDEAEVYLKLLAPFAPHLTEELWEGVSQVSRVSQVPREQKARDTRGTRGTSIHTEAWPEFDEKYLVSQMIKIAVQVNGKLRGILEVASTDAGDEAKIKELAQSDAKVNNFIKESKIKQVIYIVGKVVNIVVE
jgi:leucyl-tRNA synthetase